jgi:hypothetical protein
MNNTNDLENNEMEDYHHKVSYPGNSIISVPHISYYDADGWYHRISGPAIKCVDGQKWWYLHGKKVECNSQEEFARLLKMKVFW